MTLVMLGYAADNGDFQQGEITKERAPSSYNVRRNASNSEARSSENWK